MISLGLEGFPIRERIVHMMDDYLNKVLMLLR